MKYDPDQDDVPDRGDEDILGQSHTSFKTIMSGHTVMT